MTSGEWQAAWQIYDTACDLPSDQQRAFVDWAETDIPNTQTDIEHA